MSIYERHDVFPEWEPIPWNASGSAVDEQENGFINGRSSLWFGRKSTGRAFPRMAFLARIEIGSSATTLNT